MSLSENKPLECVALSLGYEQKIIVESLDLVIEPNRISVMVVVSLPC